MAKNKIYAVKKGKTVGIFRSWNECNDSVNGYPGAEYKSFFTEEDANKYLSGIEKSELNISFEKGEEVLGSQIIAYVDGSFDLNIGKYAFGCVIITPNGEIVRESGNGDNPDSIALRNVTGEMLGAMFAVKWCEKNGYSAIEICYDYLGIEKWATGEWKAKNNLTKKYAQFMKENSDKLNISFKKIAAHTGNKYNEEADKLAKAALTDGKGIPKIKKGDFWFTVDDILWSDLKTILILVEEEFGTNSIQKEEKNIAYGHSVSLKLGNKDKIVINYYDKGNKLVMQGKPKQLFSTILSYVTELVEIEKIPQIYNDTYKINVDQDEISSKFQYYMPNAYDKLPVKMSKTLHQAVYNLKLDGNMFDGTYLAQPVIRAIDGHLKMILLNLEIISDWKDIKIKGYDMFEKVGAKYRLRSDRYGKANTEQVKYIGNCYTFFNSNRNKLSHWDNPTAPLDTTDLLDVGKAHDLIKRTLSLIDEYYE
ncbi:MAG: reverse transcriptase-like protein [Lachnospiraceae bacterium]|nr:reverse transcriptase-like protein [Lachnospiraceae bacterium]